jgi:DNA-binding NarL/FixJ family response regulator
MGEYMDKIMIGIADDEKIIRESLKIILGSDEQIEVVGLCSNGEEAFKLCSENEIDVMLMDIRMPVMDGVTATKLIKEASLKAKILILTTFNDDEYIFDAMNYGASGYILKDTAHEIIIESIKSVSHGNIIMNPEVAAKIIQNKVSAASDEPKCDEKECNYIEKIKASFNLTPREIEVIIGVSEGLSNKEIGQKLFMTEGTVKNHITEILSKLELRDRTQIVIFAFKNNIIS